MLPDPTHRLTKTETAVWVHDAKRHAVLGFVIEQGSGALPERQQVELFFRDLAPRSEPDAAAALRRKLEAAERPLAIVKP